MNPRPRGRYKKKKRDLILYLKITLICYLAIFGVAYMSSDTSANFSSQSVLTGSITADIWEVPEVPALACGMEEDTAEKVPGDESSTTSEDKGPEATVVTVKDPVTGEEVEVDCGDSGEATEGEVETGKSKEVDCKKTEAPESTEQVTIDCKDEEEEAAKEAEEPAIEKGKEKEKAAEGSEVPAVDEEKAEKEETAEVKTPVIEKEKEEKENAPAAEKEKEVKPQNESITEEKEVNKEAGAKAGADESKESEVQKPNNESPIPPKSNDENKSDESS